MGSQIVGHDWVAKLNWIWGIVILGFLRTIRSAITFSVHWISLVYAHLALFYCEDIFRLSVINFLTRNCPFQSGGGNIIDGGNNCMGASLVVQPGRICLPVQKTWVQSLGQENPLKKEMETHSSILAQGIPWTEEPGGLQSLGSPRLGHNLPTKQQQQLHENRKDCWCGVLSQMFMNSMAVEYESGRGGIFHLVYPNMSLRCLRFEFNGWMFMLKVTEYLNQTGCSRKCILLP